MAVFACGNDDRADDGIAILAAARLAPKVRGLADIHVVRTLELESLVAVPLDVALLVVDAVAGPAVGAILEIDLEDLASMRSLGSPCSTHRLPLDQVLALAGLLRGAPLRGRFIGMAIETASPGAPLSEAVGMRVPTLVGAVERSVMHLSRAGRAAANEVGRLELVPERPLR